MCFEIPVINIIHVIEHFVVSSTFFVAPLREHTKVLTLVNSDTREGGVGRESQRILPTVSQGTKGPPGTIFGNALPFQRKTESHPPLWL